MEPVAFDPFALGATQDPYEPLARLREAAPVAPIDGGFWAVTGHAEALEALRPWTETTAVALLDSLDGAGSRGRTVDLLNSFAHQLPSLVISELLACRRRTGTYSPPSATA